jgi:hypothetical protein
LWQITYREYLIASFGAALVEASTNTDGQTLRSIEPDLVAKYAYAYADAILAEGVRRGG